MLILASQFSKRPLLIWENGVMAAIERGSIVRISNMELASVHRFAAMRKLVEINVNEVDPAIIEDYLKQTGQTQSAKRA
ncbi:PJ [Pseudomonas phage phi8]|uniref:PJ n=1 Tax=Pseudomonas phage phi8 TaxID=120086 RepID=B4DCU1_9VIRU|nr:PJ [Pseudomonas phage phi8]ACG69470.1 PJ [Pseudomonas phage phi8]